MPTDLSLPLRRGIVTALKGWVPLTASGGRVKASNIYGEMPDSEPELPFIRYGTGIATGFEATCWSGSLSRVTVHAFANGPFSDAVLEIAGHVVNCIDALVITGLSITDNLWVGTNLLIEGENPSIYHAVIEFDITAVE